MYPILRNILFTLSPETSHNVSLSGMDLLNACHLLKLFAPKVACVPTRVMGIDFPNPVGLAAGLDKDGDHINALGQLGFGFIEIGTVTPKPQVGNPKPRLFRLPEHQAIINRMGFNNLGVDHLVDQVRSRLYTGVLGINIGKNAATPVEKAVEDYRIGLRRVYLHADYITVNISSPNTPNLRTLQYGDQLKELLEMLKSEQAMLSETYHRYVPIAVKIAPDMTEDEVETVAKSLLEAGIDGVIATNTTLDRDKIVGHAHAAEAGGLSGAPLTDKATQIISQLHAVFGDKIPIIGAGGIIDADSAVAKIAAGASLIQLYSGFIYRGPDLIAEAVDAIASYRSG